MIIILHGENIVKSRDHLVQLTREAKLAGKDVVRVTATQLTPAELESALQKTSLFGTEQLVVIEELHSLPKSNRKNLLVETVSHANVDVILWEKRELTKPMLKKFPRAQVKYFKITNSLFAWLDIFSPKTPKPKQLTLLQQAVQTNGEHMCFVMLARQIRLLIKIKDGSIPPGPPFMIAKLKKQAQDFTLEKLLKIHDQLFMIDQAAKTSGSFFTLGQELDLLTVNL